MQNCNCTRAPNQQTLQPCTPKPPEPLIRNTELQLDGAQGPRRPLAVAARPGRPAAAQHHHDAHQRRRAAARPGVPRGESPCLQACESCSAAQAAVHDESYPRPLRARPQPTTPKARPCGCCCCGGGAVARPEPVWCCKCPPPSLPPTHTHTHGFPHALTQRHAGTCTCTHAGMPSRAHTCTHTRTLHPTQLSAFVLAAPSLSLSLPCSLASSSAGQAVRIGRGRPGARLQARMVRFRGPLATRAAWWAWCCCGVSCNTTRPPRVASCVAASSNVRGMRVLGLLCNSDAQARECPKNFTHAPPHPQTAAHTLPPSSACQLPPPTPTPNQVQAGHPRHGPLRALRERGRSAAAGAALPDAAAAAAAAPRAARLQQGEFGGGGCRFYGSRGFEGLWRFGVLGFTAVGVRGFTLLRLRVRESSRCRCRCRRRL